MGLSFLLYFFYKTKKSCLSWLIPGQRKKKSDAKIKANHNQKLILVLHVHITTRTMSSLSSIKFGVNIGKQV